MREISFPSSDKEISANAFSDCFFLKKVSISEESDLHSIGENASLYTSIESIFIPSKVSFVGALSLSTRRQLKNVKISTPNKNFSIFNDSFLLGKSYLYTNRFNSSLFLLFSFELMHFLMIDFHILFDMSDTSKKFRKLF